MLPDTRLARQNVVLQTLGYGRFQRLCWLVIPEIAPALGATMLAVLAWSEQHSFRLLLHVALGQPLPGQYRQGRRIPRPQDNGDIHNQTKGMLLCLLMLALLAVLSALGFGIWKAWRRTLPALTGVRRTFPLAPPARMLSGILPACGMR